MQVHTPGATTTRDGAFLALALADALSLGLPGPDYITMHPHYARSAVGFQFNDRHGQDPLPALHAWAGRFGVTVSVSDGTGATWHRLGFRHAGVLFHAYAEIQAAAEAAGPCAECGHLACDCADDMGEDATDSIAGDDAAAVLAQAVAAGTPVIAGEDEPLPACAGCGHAEADHDSGPGGDEPIARGRCHMCLPGDCPAYLLPDEERAHAIDMVRRGQEATSW